MKLKKQRKKDLRSTEVYDTHWSNERAYKKGIRDFVERVHREYDEGTTENLMELIDNIKVDMVGE